jgi:hypothetical protein
MEVRRTRAPHAGHYKRQCKTSNWRQRDIVLHTKRSCWYYYDHIERYIILKAKHSRSHYPARLHNGIRCHCSQIDGFTIWAGRAPNSAQKYLKQDFRGRLCTLIQSLIQPSPHHRPFLLLIMVLLIGPSLTLLLALVAILCSNALRSQTALLPSATAISSLATLSASLTSLRFSDASSIHCIDCRRRCRTLRGWGIGCIAPPPSIPRC